MLKFCCWDSFDFVSRSSISAWAYWRLVCSDLLASSSSLIPNLHCSNSVRTLKSKLSFSWMLFESWVRYLAARSAWLPAVVNFSRVFFVSFGASFSSSFSPFNFASFLVASYHNVKIKQPLLWLPGGEILGGHSYCIRHVSLHVTLEPFFGRENSDAGATFSPRIMCTSLNTAPAICIMRADAHKEPSLIHFPSKMSLSMCRPW